MSLTLMPDVQQGTTEWHDQRRGMVTASAVWQLLTTGSPSALTVACPRCDAEPDAPCVSLAKSTAGAAIKTLHPDRAEVAAALPPVLTVADNDTSRRLTATLVAERITGVTDPTFMNADMTRGVWHEPYARAAYADHHGVEVAEIGFMVRDDWGFEIGASPDGLVGSQGGIEIKCPRAKSHMDTVLADEVPAAHMAQVQACLLVSGCDWWDYVSFCGGLPLWTKRVTPDPVWHDAITAAVAQFERVAAERITAFTEAAKSLPATERVPDLDLVF